MNRAVLVATSAVGLSIAGGGCLHGDEAGEGLTRRTSSEQIADAWLRENRLPERARRGAEIFDIAGCLACHTYLDAGVRSLGAPELTAIGAKRGRDEGYFVRYVSDPAAFGNDVMPKFESLGRANLRALAVFLESSRGGR